MIFGKHRTEDPIYSALATLEEAGRAMQKEMRNPKYRKYWEEFFAFIDANPGITFEEMDEAWDKWCADRNII